MVPKATCRLSLRLPRAGIVVSEPAGPRRGRVRPSSRQHSDPGARLLDLQLRSALADEQLRPTAVRAIVRGLPGRARRRSATLSKRRRFTCRCSLTGCSRRMTPGATARLRMPRHPAGHLAPAAPPQDTSGGLRSAGERRPARRGRGGSRAPPGPRSAQASRHEVSQGSSSWASLERSCISGPS